MKNIDNKSLFKYSLVFIAMLIAIASLIVSNLLVQELSQEEHNKIEIWAEATKEATSNDENVSMHLIVQILESNTTIPVVLYDVQDDYYLSTNIELPEKDVQDFLRKKVEAFKKKKEPIVIEMADLKQYLYYDDSYTLKKLQLYPYIQLGILGVFILIAFFALFSTMRMEQDRVWVGLSKETAHQLGTPISSLLAWVEYLRLKDTDPSILADMEKDVNRLQMITDRFSKIGSVPNLEKKDINEIILRSISYLEHRISKKVSFVLDLPDQPIYTNISESLFSWVIENLSKNAVDAMGGYGKITFSVFTKGQIVYIEIEDTGKGIPKSKFKRIFEPGYTTKERGWGLGLSLTKRIIETYHKGKIYVKSSEINQGTTFRIELKKSVDVL